MPRANSGTQSRPDAVRLQRASWRLSISAIGLMILMQLPIARYLSPGDGIAATTGHEAVYWALTALLIGYIRLIEEQPLSSVRLQPLTWQSLLYGLVSALIMVGGMAALYVFVLPLLGPSNSASGLATINALPGWLRFLIVVRAAVFEELYFRGFMIERLTDILGLRWLAVVISITAFTLAHLSYWGWAHLIIAGFGGLVLTGLYLIRKDLGTNMIAHFLTDAVGFLLG